MHFSVKDFNKFLVGYPNQHFKPSLVHPDAKQITSILCYRNMYTYIYYTNFRKYSSCCRNVSDATFSIRNVLKLLLFKSCSNKIKLLVVVITGLAEYNLRTRNKEACSMAHGTVLTG